MRDPKVYLTLIVAACLEFLSTALVPAAPQGYYRQPALHGDTIVFVAEGDLWKVGTAGGSAIRLTSHPGEESQPAISSDGKTIAFVAQYEGPSEVYTMPIAGGLPTRRTFDGQGDGVVGWTPDGKILISTRISSTLPDAQLATLDISGDNFAAKRALVPLAQAAEGSYDDSGKTLYFTRLAYQGSHTKRYQGGTAQQLWRYADGEAEATPLTEKYDGTSRNPMWWKDRLYFLTDRDGTMNVWSMKGDGTDLQQHTHSDGWDIMSASLSEGKIAYQVGADLHLYDISAGTDRLVPITLDSDLDQTREHWVKNPGEYVSAVHLSPDGSHVVLTARGQVFVAPVDQGRLVQATHQQGVRFRDARFMPDGKHLLVLSDQSGEVEFWQAPANGVGEPDELTTGAKVLRWEGLPSPDGKFIAHHDKNQRMYLFDVKTKEQKLIDESPVESFSDLAWSPDSKWLAYVDEAKNLFRRIKLYDIASGKTSFATTDRFDSYSPAWSADGKWLYLLSDRHLQTVVHAPWGTYEPEPFLGRRAEIFLIALDSSLTRTPFQPNDELHPAKKEEQSEKSKKESATTGPTTRPSTTNATQTQSATEPSDAGKGSSVKVKIDLDGIEDRLVRAPIPPGNYAALHANDKGIYWLSSPTEDGETTLQSAALSHEKVEVKTVASGVSGYELSMDGKRMLIGKGGDRLYVIDAKAEPADLSKKQVDLSHLSLSVIPREEWKSMFVDAWRMERDYFYDRNMHGVDWKAIEKKYEPLVDRVTSRDELSDLLGQMISELSALHMFVRGGDMRSGEDRVMPASLGATLIRDVDAKGYRVGHIYRSDPDEPDWAGPLARFGVKIHEGDVIEMIDGVPTLSVPDVSMLLRNTADQQVLLRVKPKAGGESRDVIVKPMPMGTFENLRYHEWEYTRRLKVEQEGKGQIGYVHLRAMSGPNFTEWAKGFYPVWNRQGLIIDVRHNRGGNIDSWIIGRLLRKAWAYWSTRVSDFSTWNMQYAFRGHVVVLCDQWTASDGEAFTEGIKELKIGTVIGKRTWGGEIWLSMDNGLVDRGIASAAENGVFGTHGSWLIEGHGVDPDIVVDNLPHATFEGHDAQLETAIDYLQKKIKAEPVNPVPPPKYPNKAFVKPGSDKPVNKSGA